MWGRRIFYLCCLLGSLVFYFVYQQWFSWMLLLLLLLLPWFSLALSLPAMHGLSVKLRCPAMTRWGVPARTGMRLSCRYPIPPMDCKIRLVNTLTGESYLGKPGEWIPTDHCGRITVTVPRCVVHDYLGLFTKGLPEQEIRTVFVLPKPIAGELPQPGSQNDSILKPKSGGLAEFHELRLYRPGDELRHIHWKLSAKTGKLIYRQAMVQAKKGFVLSLSLSGTPDQVDRKLGQLLWTSRVLLRQKRPHQIRCLTGKGTVSFTVTDEATLEEGLCNLLSMPRAVGENLPETADALWYQQIGGDSHAD